jgi:hypothetical protein
MLRAPAPRGWSDRRDPRSFVTMSDTFALLDGVGTLPRDRHSANLLRCSRVVMLDEAAAQASVLSIVCTVSCMQQMEFVRDLAPREGGTLRPLPQSSGCGYAARRLVVG